jgi:lysophospholipase L1-like esterase
VVGLPFRSRRLVEPPRLSAVRIGAVASLVGAGGVSALAALAYLQARLSVTERAHATPALDGHFGVSEDHVLCRVVWLGDSLAAGLGAISPELSLPRLVATGRDQHTRLHVFAEPGATSADVVTNQLPALEQLRHGLGQIGQRVDAIGVTVGANDIAALTPRHHFRRNVRRIIEAADGAPVVLVSIPHLSHAIGIPRPLRTFASWRASWLDLTLRAAAHRPDVHYASVRRRPAWIRRRDLRNFLAADRFHPSGAGYAVWAGLVTEAFDAALAPALLPDAAAR